MIHNGAPNSHVITGVIKITIIAIRFALRSILPSRCQLVIDGPKDRCSRSQLFSRDEERANAKAATSRNGVVGNNGSIRPTIPMATEIRPASSQRILMPVSTLPVHHTRTGTDKSGRARMNRLTSQGHVTLLIVHFVRTLNSKGEPFGSPFSFGGDGWNGPPCGRPVARLRQGSDEPPSVLESTISGKQKTPHEGAFLCLVVMGGIEPPTYGL